MKKQILFIQGAGEGAYEADAKLAGSLRTALGNQYEVRYPEMPDPAYEAWKARIAKECATMESEIIFVGHSFGASVLLKYLAEGDAKADGIFLIAAPYWGMDDWEVQEFTLPKNFAAHLPDAPIFLYHSQDDEIVPFEHLSVYAEKLPQATVREFKGRDHQLNDDLSEVAQDIKGI